MIPARAPIILTGQLFLHGELNEYMIITDNRRGQVHYAGKGFRGHSEDQSFVERFQPVNPVDVDADEVQELLSFCPPKTIVSTGFISEDQ